MAILFPPGLPGLCLEFVRGPTKRLRALARAGHAAWTRLRPSVAGATAEARRRLPFGGRATLAAMVVLLGGWTAWERCGVRGCPDVERLSSYQPEGATILLDRDGERLAELPPVDHEVVPIDDLPDHVTSVFIAVEDKRFHEHRGVDWRRVLGALLVDLRSGAPLQGSSTISMQLSRNLFPERIRAREKSLRRKLLEVRVAGDIEERFSKREILELYLNHIYFGSGAYGIESASREYFRKPARELRLDEAAALAALPRAPSHYDPRQRPDAARERRDLVLRLAEEQGRVTTEKAEAARRRSLAVAGPIAENPPVPGPAPWFVQQVRRRLEEELGEEAHPAPLRVFTTLDRSAQEVAERELRRQVRAVERGAFWRFGRPGRRAAAGRTVGDRPEPLEGAVVMMDAHRGDVLAWVGGRSFARSRFDRALLARRQAGSAFKPFVYAAALEEGLMPNQPILDAPFRFEVEGERAWEPRNHSGSFLGRMSMRDALVQSQNVPAVRLAAAVGERRVASLARRAGIEGEVPATPVAALGVTSVGPAELTAAYSAFASGGSRVDPRFLLRIEDAEGNVLWESEPERTEVLEPELAFLLTDMLRDAVDRGTGSGVRRAGFHGPAAGKTGTTDGPTDVWFVGYTPEIVGTVWIGFDEVRPLPSGATGGAVAAPVWGRIMARLEDDRPMRAAPEVDPEVDPEAWPTPDEVVTLDIDPASGLVLAEGCHPLRGEAHPELFLARAHPATVCPRGEQESGQGLLHRLGGWVDALFGSRGDQPPGGDENDPHLGAPRVSGADGTGSRPLG